MQTDVDVEALDIDSASEIVATYGPFELTRTAAIAMCDATFDEWAATFKWCQAVEKASPFWVGDLVAYGEQKYGEMYAQAMDATRYSYGTLANAAYVARRVESSRRREHLSFGHHQEVAPLPPQEQTEWLDKAEVQELTIQQLRIHIKAAAAESVGHPVELWLQVRCADVTDQNELAERLRGEGRAVKNALPERCCKSGTIPRGIRSNRKSL
jgi:hypothetical protein